MSPKGPYSKGVAKREEILATALGVIAEHGFSNTSIKELADAVRLSQPGLLHYFDSKNELFTEVLRKRDEAALAAHADSRAVETFRQTIAHNEQVPGLVQLFASVSTAGAVDPEHPAHDFMRQRYANLIDFISGDIEQLQAEGAMRPDLDAREFASLLLAAADGLQTQWLLNPEYDMSAHFEQLFRLAAPQGAADPSTRVLD